MAAVCEPCHHGVVMHRDKEHTPHGRETTGTSNKGSTHHFQRNASLLRAIPGLQRSRGEVESQLPTLRLKYVPGARLVIDGAGHRWVLRGCPTPPHPTPGVLLDYLTFTPEQLS
jgi:hypothetical protein